MVKGAKMNHETSRARLALSCILLFTLLRLNSGCAPKTDATVSTAFEQPRVETMRHNGITLVMTITPASVSLNRDLILSLKLTHPESVVVSLPPLSDRLQGLLASSSFDRESAPATDGRITRERVIRLTPLIAPEYRIAPMAVTFRNAISGASVETARRNSGVVARLKQFLEAADLVKFAAWKPDRGAVENAVLTAREYVTSDADAANTDIPKRE